MKNKKKNKFKNLFIKLKKTNKIFRFLFITTLILYVASPEFCRGTIYK